MKLDSCGIWPGTARTKSVLAHAGIRSRRQSALSSRFGKRRRAAIAEKLLCLSSKTGADRSVVHLRSAAPAQPIRSSQAAVMIWTRGCSNEGESRGNSSKRTVVAAANTRLIRLLHACLTYKLASAWGGRVRAGRRCSSPQKTQLEGPLESALIQPCTRG